MRVQPQGKDLEARCGEGQERNPLESLEAGVRPGRRNWQGWERKGPYNAIAGALVGFNGAGPESIQATTEFAGVGDPRRLWASIRIVLLTTYKRI